ncbi:MAG: hypothetical protein WCL11_23095, partial [Verrucomicrobiota bacterium]
FPHPTHTQGSAQRATLGYVIASFQDKALPEMSKHQSLSSLSSPEGGEGLVFGHSADWKAANPNGDGITQPSQIGQSQRDYIQFWSVFRKASQNTRKMPIKQGFMRVCRAASQSHEIGWNRLK